MKIPALLKGLWQKVKSAEWSPEDLIFEGVWRRRQWRIDDMGVHEFRQGHPYTTVFWADLAGFDGQKLRAINGAGSKVLLPQDRLAKFRAALYIGWGRRFPERVRVDQALALRKFAWFAFLWLPFVDLIVCLTLYFLPHFVSRSDASNTKLSSTANRMVIISAVSLCILWAVYGYARQKFRASDPAFRRADPGKH